MINPHEKLDNHLDIYRWTSDSGDAWSADWVEDLVMGVALGWWVLGGAVALRIGCPVREGSFPGRPHEALGNVPPRIFSQQKARTKTEPMPFPDSNYELFR